MLTELLQPSLTEGRRCGNNKLGKLDTYAGWVDQEQPRKMVEGKIRGSPTV